MTPEGLWRLLARAAAAVPSTRYRRSLFDELFRRDAASFLEVIGPKFNRTPTLDSLPLDLDPATRLEFEDLAGLFASSALNHGLIGMTIRQAAYVFGIARRLPARSAIEIGRFRGGTTIVLAAAMAPHGRLWSIDLGEKEARWRAEIPESRPFDEQTSDFCKRFGLDAVLLAGDSRTIELDTGEVDLVLIDGDHSYEGARSDFERFGMRVRRGGAVLLDDAFDEALFPAHTDTVGRVVREATSSGAFRLVRAVDRMAHLERVE